MGAFDRADGRHAAIDHVPDDARGDKRYLNLAELRALVSHSRNMPRKLKVFRTAIGFHDAYIAAPSRKAALAAWGAGADLFARGAAEEVDDVALTRKPLASPGEVILVSRGDLEEHLKALPRRRPSKARKSEPAARPRKPRPPPRRDRIDAAEAALADLIARQTAETDRLERALEALREKQAKERAALERKRDAARTAYRDALDRWTE